MASCSMTLHVRQGLLLIGATETGKMHCSMCTPTLCVRCITKSRRPCCNTSVVKSAILSPHNVDVITYSAGNVHSQSLIAFGIAVLDWCGIYAICHSVEQFLNSCHPCKRAPSDRSQCLTSVTVRLSLNLYNSASFTFNSLQGSQIGSAITHITSAAKCIDLTSSILQHTALQHSINTKQWGSVLFARAHNSMLSAVDKHNASSRTAQLGVTLYM